jgi:putative ABC transport system permease protein
VLKALGASRRQVGAGVLWHASFLALPAIVIGVPLGVIVGRAGWRVFARNLGVVSGPVVSPVVLLVVAVVALLITNALAVWPSWRAVHLRTADALRSE